MPYRYLEEIAIADAAFEAWGESLEEMLLSAADATVNIMVGDLESIRGRERRMFEIPENPADMLLFELLQQLVFYKDAEQLLLRAKTIRLGSAPGGNWRASVEFAGETINPQLHDLIVDIKAITLHRFEVKREESGWKARVIVDV